MKKVALHNLGCKVNAYETEAMQQQLEQNGYEIVPFAEGADIYIINTCTVTNIADRKSRQMLHKAKKMNPESIVVAVGCYVQAAKEDLEIDNAIDIVIGNNKKNELIQILQDYEAENSFAESVLDISQTREYEEMSLDKVAEHTRAYIKIQDGCNQFCSYCIIPYTRGRVRSRRMDDIINEVRNITNNGFKEIVLTGIHLSSYGIDLEDSRAGLLELIQKLHETEGLERIRLGSLEPRIITDQFVAELSKLNKFCPHFHLSLQSGCDKTLKRMNRRYTVSEYYNKCELIRSYFKHPAITTDIIVGFPGETEEEFEETKKYLEKIKFSEMHVFKYSKRKGTKAADMEQQVPDQVKNTRSNELISLCKMMSMDYRNSFLGQKTTVLFEEEIILDNKKYQVGHTMEYVKVAVLTEEDFTNKIMEVIVKNPLTDEILLAETSFIY